MLTTRRLSAIGRAVESQVRKITRDRRSSLAAAQRRAASIAALEPRMLFAVLQLSGTTNPEVGDVISITQLGSTITVTINGGQATYSSAEYTSIQVNCFAGSDTVKSTAALPLLVYGGPGEDWIDTGAGNDTLWGGPDNDTLRADGGDDSLYGDDGDDDLRGALDDDTLSGGDGADLLTPGVGSDSLLGGTDNDIYIFDDPDVGGETDTIQESADEGTEMLDFRKVSTSASMNVRDPVMVTGGYKIAWSSGRTVVGTTASDVENVRMPQPAHGGLNEFWGNVHTTRAIGGDAADRFVCTAALQGVEIEGGDDADLLYGSASGDTIFGQKGNDTLYGYGGNDLLNGNADADTVYAGTGNDTVYGGMGDDSLLGDDGVDVDYGEAGNDTLIGGLGTDRLYGGDGTDSCPGAAANEIDTPGVTYYISTSGVDDDINRTGTSTSTAWKTFEFALARMLPQDTLKVGSYYARSSPLVLNIPYITVTSSDSIQSRIDLAFARVDPQQGGPGDGTWESTDPADDQNYKQMEDWSRGGSTIQVGVNARGVTLDNLEISGGYYAVKAETTWDDYDDFARGYGMYTRSCTAAATELTITGCEIHSSAFDLIKLTNGTDGAVIDDNILHDSGLAYPTWYPRDDGTHSWNAEGIDAVNVDDAVVEDNTIYGIKTNGIYFKGGSRNALIQRNYLHHLEFSGIILGQSSDVGNFDPVEQLDEGIYYESIGGTVRNNIVQNSYGAGMIAWAAKDASFLNNTVDNVATGERAGIEFVSQTHWLEGTNPSSRPYEEPVHNNNVTVTNNIMRVPASSPVILVDPGETLQEFHISHNQYYSSTDEVVNNKPFWDKRSGTTQELTWDEWKAIWELKDEHGLVHSQIGDPVLTSNGRLDASSPCKDKGTNLGGFDDDIDEEDRDDGVFDIGADEL